MSERVPRIDTERLVLEPLAVSHAADLFPLYSDPETMRFWHAPRHAGVERTRSLIEEMVARPRACWFALHLRFDENGGGPRAAGLVGFHGGTVRSGFGYLLRRDLWGHGLALEASRAAIAHGFGTLCFERLELWVHEANDASKRLAAKLGASERGRFRQLYPGEGFTRETVVYGIDGPGSRRRELVSVEPVLAVRDVAASLAFYRDKLGFEVEYAIGAPPFLAGLARGEWSVSAARLQLAHAATPEDARANGSLFFRLEAGVDELCAELRSRGVTIASEPATQPWGIREFSLVDPDGRLLRFGGPA